MLTNAAMQLRMLGDKQAHLAALALRRTASSTIMVRVINADTKHERHVTEIG